MGELYNPAQSTPLYDALGKSITRLKEDLPKDFYLQCSCNCSHRWRRKRFAYLFRRRHKDNVSGVAVSAGNKSTNCPPTTNVCKKHYRLIKHCTPHCGNPLLPDALLAVEGIVESV
jgi:hypothetical protein